MKTLMQWPIKVQNPVTGEWVSFLGDGFTVAQAIKDGIDCALAPFRPDSSGGAKPKLGIGVAGRVAVTLLDGRTVLRELKDFESEQAYNAAKEERKL